MRPAAIVAIAAALALGACGGGGGVEEAGEAQPRPSADPSAPGREAEEEADGTSLEPAACAPAVEGCVSASGSIIYVERVDPDGDGDAHFVLASREGVTFPGVTVVDVRQDLRPHPLPGPGDRISAAGPVFRGSYGQRQIQAEVLNVEH